MTIKLIRALLPITFLFLAINADAIVTVTADGDLKQVSGSQYSLFSSTTAFSSIPGLYVSATTGFDFKCPFNGAGPIRGKDRGIALNGLEIGIVHSKNQNPGYTQWTGGTADCTHNFRGTGDAGSTTAGFSYVGIGVAYQLVGFSDEDERTIVKTFVKTPPPPPPICTPCPRCQIP
ncbi:hypothetical protein [Microbulbifer sediminum]|uniref:hypothetical protein n=1 Tax=Microbulbifer sediminum TaxID=2904250 RepID=UPI001F368CFD|nr:hypothetical protein [Microbulbifer sediminum]